MCNVTGNAGAKGYSEVSGNEWQWQNYYGYAYDGEMWMTAGTTYTFGGNFDDGSAILVDGAVVWSQGNSGGTASGYNNWVAPADLHARHDGVAPRQAARLGLGGRQEHHLRRAVRDDVEHERDNHGGADERLEQVR